MVLAKLSLLGTVGLLSGLVNAQFPPKPEGVTVLESKLEEGVRISYKEVHLLPEDIFFQYSPANRPTSAKPQKVFAVSPAMFIFPLERSRISASKIRRMRSTRTFGSSSPEKILPTHPCQYG